MTEGGVFPWKIQKVQVAPTFDYSKMGLDSPPEGLQWLRDEATREWRLVETSTDKKPPEPAIQMSSQTSTFAIQESIIAVAVEVDTAVPIIETSPVLNVDHVTSDNVIYHKVQTTDTIQGLCIRYKVTPTQLRQWNRFTGSNLLLAPDILIIRVDPKDTSVNSEKEFDHNERNRKVQKFLMILEHKTGVPYCKSHKLSLSPVEAEAYIEMYDGNVEKAVDGAIKDLEWEGL